jgi:GR25 family glycosyltransferase involved in LPS biosynthesis
MANIPTFCISLDKYLLQWPIMAARFAEAGLTNVTRIPGVLAAVTEASIWNQYRLKSSEPRRYEVQFDGVGAVGCFLAHQNVWTKMVNENIAQALICEDDIMFNTHFSVDLPMVLASLPSPFSVLLLHYIKFFEHKSVTAQLLQLQGPFFGLGAYLLTLEGARQLLARSHQIPIEIHADAFMGCVAALEDTFIIYALQHRLGRVIWRPSDIHHRDTMWVMPHINGVILIIAISVLLVALMVANIVQYWRAEHG